MLYLKLFSKDKDVYLLKPPLHSHSNHWLNVITFDKNKNQLKKINKLFRKEKY